MSEMPWIKSYPQGGRRDAPIEPEPDQKLLEDAAGMRLAAEVIHHVRFDPKAALADISGQKVTVFAGIPDEYRGQSPKAFISLKEGAKPFTLEELQGFLKDKLGKHEMVHALEIRADLPKTAVGKLSKKDLVDEEQRKQATRA